MNPKKEFDWSWVFLYVGAIAVMLLEYVKG